MPFESPNELVDFHSLYYQYLSAWYESDDPIIVNGNPPPPEPDSSLHFLQWIDQTIDIGDPFTVQNEMAAFLAELMNSYVDLDPSNTPTVTVQVDSESNRAAAEAAAADMKKAMEQIDRQVDTLDDSATVPWPDGTTKTGAQVKALWAAMDFVVTDRAYGPGRGGAVVGTTSYMNFQNWNDWDALPDGGNFILLHELVHTDPAVIAYIQSQFDAYIATALSAAAAALGKSVASLTASERSTAISSATAGFDHGDIEFRNGEARTNRAAYLVADLLDIDISTALSPTHGVI